MAVSFKAMQAANKRKTIILIAMMASLTAFVVYAIGLYMGVATTGLVPFVVLISVGGTWWSYYASDRIVMTMTGARVIEESDAPQLYNIVQEVVIASGMPMPKVAIVEDDAPNAFATGRDPEHAVIAFTTGILRVMDREQLQGVVAHEMAHVANRDTLVSAVAATTAGAIALMSDMVSRILWFGGGRDRDRNANPIALIGVVIVIILAPLAAMLLRSAISRNRESLADATGVEFTRNPAGLRRALEQLEKDSTVVRQRSTSVAHVWIESPLDSSFTSKLFATHPPLSERIASLKAIESGTYEN
ncbi:MAG: M48 family metalloprotease [Actinobacteria bacterium]|nr:M48 family metalloprotease [Actinomycetota bacterium]